MNPNIGKLVTIAGKERRRILGLMSGTSLDGLDIALCNIRESGISTRLFLERFTTVPYDESFKLEVRKVFAKTFVDLQWLCVLNAHIGRVHGEIILNTLAEWGVPPEEIDLIASHGQTVFHAPHSVHGLEGYPNATLQIGDGDHIAVQTGILTVSDFRQKHVAAGGEGAPLAVYGDFLLFSDAHEDRVLLNLGGIANFTFLPRSRESTQVFTTDTGPANTLMDACCQRDFNLPFDAEGSIARSGSVNTALLEDLLSDPFFKLPFPKSTGPERFNLSYLWEAQLRTQTEGLSPTDLLSTLTHLTAESVGSAIRRSVPNNAKPVIYASGGGANNPYLMELIKQKAANFELRQMETLGIPGDAKEAVLFALLANEAIAASIPAMEGRREQPALSLGKISFPT
jgi:anhydro-N-acetylmuramic acid kinase